MYEGCECGSCYVCLLNQEIGRLAGDNRKLQDEIERLNRVVADQSFQLVAAMQYGEAAKKKIDELRALCAARPKIREYISGYFNLEIFAWLAKIDAAGRGEG